MTPDRILVATDFSPDSNEAMRVAAEMAKALGSELLLVHVDEPWVQAARTTEQTKRRQKSIIDLERARRALESSGVVTHSLLRGGTPAREIVEVAGAERVRLIVMGMRGQSPMVAALLGGVVYDVLRKAPCPVLTVRSFSARRSRSARKPLRR